MVLSTRGRALELASVHALVKIVRATVSIFLGSIWRASSAGRW
jgi:hypothetical protein